MACAALRLFGSCLHIPDFDRTAIHSYILRQEAEPWNTKQTAVIFWTRRFFRIAPLYYVLLIVALILGPSLGDFRSSIASIWPYTSTQSQRYLDQSILNLISHLTFVFGFIPDYAFRTALPDWSIGLEMQFYAAFPLIMLLMSRYGPLAVSATLVIGCFALQYFFSSFFDRFEAPTFLPMKLHVFQIGMWIAIGRGTGKMTMPLFLSILSSALPLSSSGLLITSAQILMTIGMFYIMNNESLPGTQQLRPLIAFIRSLLSNKFAVFLGSTSYAVYLLHLLILLPVSGLLVAYSEHISP